MGLSQSKFLARQLYCHIIFTSYYLLGPGFCPDRSVSIDRWKWVQYPSFQVTCVFAHHSSFSPVRLLLYALPVSNLVFFGSSSACAACIFYTDHRWVLLSASAVWQDLCLAVPKDPKKPGISNNFQIFLSWCSSTVDPLSAHLAFIHAALYAACGMHAIQWPLSIAPLWI